MEEEEIKFSVLVVLLTLIQRVKYDYVKFYSLLHQGGPLFCVHKVKKGKGNIVLIPLSQHMYISNNSTFVN